LANFLVTMSRTQFEDILVSADDRDEAIQKVWEGRGHTIGKSDSEWKYDGTCEQLD